MVKYPNHMRIPSLGTSIHTYSKNGQPDHIGVDVGMEYTFHFKDDNLIKIEKFSVVSNDVKWDIFSTKEEIRQWMNLKGSRELYEYRVLPSLLKFNKRNKTKR